MKGARFDLTVRHHNWMFNPPLIERANVCFNELELAVEGGERRRDLRLADGNNIFKNSKCSWW